MSTEWVKVGAEVVVRIDNRWSGRSYGETRKIAKVYKTGNFVTEGDAQQWKPVSDYAYRTGDSYYSRGASLVPLNDETRADVARVRLLNSARVILKDEIARLEKIRAEDGIIAEAERIRSRSR